MIQAEREGSMLHYLVLGPSGVGKTCFGNYLEEKGNYKHLRIDRWDENVDGIDVEGLRKVWNILCQTNDPGPLPGSARFK
jgi:septin family protein